MDSGENDCAAYDTRVIQYLSEQLTPEFGYGLKKYAVVLSHFPNSFHSVERIELVTLQDAHAHIG